MSTAADRTSPFAPSAPAPSPESPGSPSSAASSTAEAAPVLTVTETALAKIIELRDQEEDPGPLALRVEVTGVNGVDYAYDLAFEVVADVDEGDAVYPQGDLTVWVPAASIEALAGATLDLPSSAGQPGLVLRNPNRPDPLRGVKLELTGDTAEQVRQLLDQQINPALAAHGGYASLVGVESGEPGAGDKVFITMGGGCQGCAISAMTLREGIERSIRENVPDVGEVVDVTDHNAGENPFYS
ncbi:MAG: NifU family protein [Actinobacteria bacterium]|nr:NifU family protein [Actinomycetota bacterium]